MEGNQRPHSQVVAKNERQEKRAVEQSEPTLSHSAC
jgi:hypothetical protein